MSEDMTAPWRAKGACTQIVNVDPIFSLSWLVREGPGVTKAKSICETRCPVREECVKSAVDDPNSTGLRGGFFFDQGVVRRGAAREIFALYGIEAETSQKQKQKNTQKQKTLA